MVAMSVLEASSSLSLASLQTHARFVVQASSSLKQGRQLTLVTCARTVKADVLEETTAALVTQGPDVLPVPLGTTPLVTLVNHARIL